MGKAHFVVFKNLSGLTEKQPMKAWLRQNPENIPLGLDSEKTSYQLKRALVKNGWIELNEFENHVLLVRPSENGDASFADALIDDEIQLEESHAEVEEEIVSIKFGLERDLQSALRKNINLIESGLSIIDNDKEQVNEAGRVDITARDVQGRTVIFELKAGIAQPDAVNQILAYMGAVELSEGKPPRGVLIASDFHRKVILAALTVPNLTLRRYSFQFKFEEVS